MITASIERHNAFGHLAMLMENPYIGRPLEAIFGMPFRLTITVEGQEIDATEAVVHAPGGGARLDLQRVSHLIARQELLVSVRAELEAER